MESHLARALSELSPILGRYFRRRVRWSWRLNGWVCGQELFVFVDGRWRVFPLARSVKDYQLVVAGPRL